MDIKPNAIGGIGRLGIEGTSVFITNEGMII